MAGLNRDQLSMHERMRNHIIHAYRLSRELAEADVPDAYAETMEDVRDLLVVVNRHAGRARSTVRVDLV